MLSTSFWRVKDKRKRLGNLGNGNENVQNRKRIIPSIKISQYTFSLSFVFLFSWFLFISCFLVFGWMHISIVFVMKMLRKNKRIILNGFNYLPINEYSRYMYAMVWWVLLQIPRQISRELQKTTKCTMHLTIVKKFQYHSTFLHVILIEWFFFSSI